MTKSSPPLTSAQMNLLRACRTLKTTSRDGVASTAVRQQDNLKKVTLLISKVWKRCKSTDCYLRMSATSKLCHKRVVLTLHTPAAYRFSNLTLPFKISHQRSGLKSISNSTHPLTSKLKTRRAFAVHLRKIGKHDRVLDEISKGSLRPLSKTLIEGSVLRVSIR